MDRRIRIDWLLTFLTMGSFLAMVSMTIVAALDLLIGSPWSADEFGLAILCGGAFATTIRSYSFEDFSS